MSSEESSPYTSRPMSPLSTAITPPNIDSPQYEAQQPHQFSLTPLTGGGPGSTAITPLPGSVIHSPQPSTMPFHLPRGFGGAHPPAPSHLKQSQSAADILPTPEHALEVKTMREVRESIDKLDREIVTLLGTRLRFIEAAARIKEDRAKVRDEWRKRDVIEKAVKRGGEVGMDENILRGLYEVLVEGCIEYEGVRWEEIRRKPYQEAPELVGDE